MKAVRVTPAPDGGKIEVLDIPVPAVGAGQVGDVVMWDNRCTVHYTVHDYGEAERVLNRITLEGEVPV